MGDLSDRRARKKAQTRQQIRTTAHRLFAQRGFDVVTIADIARECDVAVQTVFNHFSTKEELFFDGRTPWVGGPAEAVRGREPSVPPLTALRGYLIQVSRDLVASLQTAERRCYMATLEASGTLRAHERELVFECERRLSAALLEAWTDDARDTDPPAPPDPTMAAPLVAAIWLTAGRVLIMEKRPLIAEGIAPEAVAAAVEEFATRLFAQMEVALALVTGASAAPPAENRGRLDAAQPPAKRRVG